jgi:hypothetical protein
MVTMILTSNFHKCSGLFDVSEHKINSLEGKIIVYKKGGAQKRLNKMSTSRRETPHLIRAPELSVQSMLHIIPTHSKYRDPKYLLEVSYLMNFSPSSSPTPCAEMRQAILSLPPQFQGLINLKLEAVLSHFNPGPNFTHIPQNPARKGITPHLGIPQFPMPVRLSNRDGGTVVAPIVPTFQPKLLVLMQVKGQWKYGFMEAFTRTISAKSSNGQSRLLYDLYCEICSLDVTEGDKTKSYQDGRRKIHSKFNFVSPRYLHTFCCCIQVCHLDNLSKFQHCNPNFGEARPTYKCPNCVGKICSNLNQYFQPSCMLFWQTCLPVVLVT